MDIRIDTIDLELIEELAYAFVIEIENGQDPFELEEEKLCANTIRKFVEFVKEKESEA